MKKSIVTSTLEEKKDLKLVVLEKENETGGTSYSVFAYKGPNLVDTKVFENDSDFENYVYNLFGTRQHLNILNTN
jgi:protoporphyrinogen oxidase